MSDLANVEDGFVAIIAQVLFPDTSYTPYTVQLSAPLNINLRLFRGWPVNSQLDKDLLAGVTSISVFSAPGVAKNMTMMLKSMAVTAVSKADPTMTATKVGQQITFAGTTSVSQVIGIGIHPGHPGVGYGYRLKITDTPTTVAATFAANLPSSSSTGAVLTLGDPFRVDIGTDVTTLTEVHRQEQMVMVIVWAPSVAARDLVCGYIDPALQNTNSMSFAEGSVSGPISSAGTNVDDVVQKANMWKRTLFYNIMYPTMFKQMVPAMVLGKENLGPLVFID